MKKPLIFFIAGFAATLLLAFAASKSSYYLLAQYKTNGGELFREVGAGLEKVAAVLMMPAKALLPMGTESLPIALGALSFNFSAWGVAVALVGTGLRLASRRVRRNTPV